MPGEAPILHQQALILHPGDEIVELIAHRLGQNEIVPLIGRDEALGGKVRPEPRRRLGAQSEPVDPARIDDQRHPRARLARLVRIFEDPGGVERRVGREHRHVFEPDLHQLAGQQEQGRFPGRPETRLGRGDPAEFGEGPRRLAVRDQEGIERLRPEVRQDREDQNQPLGRAELGGAHSVGIRLAPFWKRRSGLERQNIVAGQVAAMDPEAQVEKPGEPGDLRLDHRSVRDSRSGRFVAPAHSSSDAHRSKRRRSSAETQSIASGISSPSASRQSRCRRRKRTQRSRSTKKVRSRT